MSNLLSGANYESSALDNFCFLAAFLIAFFTALFLKTFLMALSTAFSTPFFLRLFRTVFSTFLWIAFATAFLSAVFFAIMASPSTAQVSVPYQGIVGLCIEISSPAVLQSREFHLFPNRKHPLFWPNWPPWMSSQLTIEVRGSSAAAKHPAAPSAGGPRPLKAVHRHGIKK